MDSIVQKSLVLYIITQIIYLFDSIFTFILVASYKASNLLAIRFPRTTLLGSLLH
jgi:hypothetical protein